MWNSSFTLALLGGVLIGLAVSAMLLLSGRITGVSGIMGGALRRRVGEWGWRVAFLMGLVLGGGVVRALHPEAFSLPEASTWQLVVAGLLVGFGTSLGSGCTSGHGVCGITRMSARSILATLTFMLTGVLVVFVVRHWIGG